MYDRIAEHIEEARTSLRIDVTDSVYARCMEELRFLREGRFERVTQSLENLRALVDQLQSRLALVEDARIDSPAVDVAGRPASANSGVRTDPQPFPSADQMRAFAHMAAELNSTRRRAREMEQTSAERSPGAPSRGPGATVPPGPSGTQEWPPTGAVPSRRAEDNLPTADANFASETQALLHAPGSMRQPRWVPPEDGHGQGGAAPGSREPILSFDPRWGGYQPADLAAHPGPVDIPTLPVTPFGTLGPAEPGIRACPHYNTGVQRRRELPHVSVGQHLEARYFG